MVFKIVCAANCAWSYLVGIWLEERSRRDRHRQRMLSRGEVCEVDGNSPERNVLSDRKRLRFPRHRRIVIDAPNSFRIFQRLGAKVCQLNIDIEFLGGGEDTLR